MYQPKVNNTQQYSDSQGEHVVCKGKLVLLHPPYSFGSDVNIHYDEDVMCRPIIISETEEIKEGDKVVHLDDNYIFTSNENESKVHKKAKKILSLPEHFSEKHLQAIVDGKMKDGDEVLVKCVGGKFNYRCNDKSQLEFFIDLDQQNHITLFPAKQSSEKAAKEYCPKRPSYSKDNQDVNRRVRKAFKAGAEWAKENNY